MFSHSGGSPDGSAEVNRRPCFASCSSKRHAAFDRRRRPLRSGVRNSARSKDVRAFYGRQAGRLWGLRGPHSRSVVVMLRAVAFRRADFAHLRRRRLPRLAHLGRRAWRYWPSSVCKTARVSEPASEQGWRLAAVWDIPLIVSVVARGPLRSQATDGESAAGFCANLASWMGQTVAQTAL
jgi:hypothetical protein